MAIFPPQLHIRVFDNDTGLGIPKIALILTLFARRKNNYSVAMVTNSVGEVHLSIESIRQSIKNDWELFPMDYESTLEECSADVEIETCTTEDVQRAIAAMKMFRSGSMITDELIQGFEHSANEQYVPVVTRVNVEESNRVAIGISRVQPAEKIKTSAQ
jgi:hypothetical protein